MSPHLRRIGPEGLSAQPRFAVDAQTLAAAADIVDDVRRRGEPALREHAERLGDLAPGEPMFLGQEALNAALRALPAEQSGLLQRAAARITAFAKAQKACLRELDVNLPGGAAGHSLAAVRRAGCYAPGGRFPLPSSVLMTACPARVAGVETVWLASPRPAQLVLAAAAVAHVDGVLCVGGAQAIAALAFGAGAVPACDAVVGPGNRWVTAAKQLVAGQTAIDMLAGPSELLILADGSASARLIAADLLAQAEHDPDALPMLISLDEDLIGAVEAELTAQLLDLPTAENARAALANGFAIFTADQEEAVRLCDMLAPEHLEIHLADAERVAARLKNYGALFVGSQAAEVLGDYAAGPNHVLPTGATARFSGGLSVFHFMRARTWLRIDDPEMAGELIDDAEALARFEGLEAHARAAALRRG